MRRPRQPCARISGKLKKNSLILGVAAILIGMAAIFFYRTRPPTSISDGGEAALSSNQTPEAKLGAATSSPSPAPGAPSGASPEAQAAIQILDQILKSKNDNDPRLDRDFHDLTAATKAALQQKYREMAPEDRNGRGTTVYLLGRVIKDASDLAFFHEVRSEKPCLNLADCSKDSPPVAGEDAHREAGVEVTLAYPQIVSLVSVDRLISSASKDKPLSAEVREGAWKLIEEGKNSPVSIVNKRARDLEQKLIASANP